MEKTGEPRLVSHISNEEIELAVREVIDDELSVGMEKIVPNANLVDNLGADSLGMAEMVMKMEDRFGIAISDKDAEVITTVKAAIVAVKLAIRSGKSEKYMMKNQAETKATT